MYVCVCVYVLCVNSECVCESTFSTENMHKYIQYLTETKLSVPELVYFFFFFFMSGLMMSKVRTSPFFSGVISRRVVVQDPM